MLRFLAFLCVLIWTAQASKAVPKIVGGDDAAEGEFPYLASLRVYNSRNDLIHFCGSSIISHWLVMTAAHCMLDYPKDRIEVVVGTNNQWSGGAKYKIDKYINHENYNETSFANDISLILVNRQIQLGEKVGLVKLPTEDIGGGLDLIIAGFGYVDNYHTRPRRMQKLTVTSITVEECRAKHKNIEKYNPITDKLLCTYKDYDEGICQGDSGGALVRNGIVHGITSWNIPCGRGKPDVFTRVYKYLDWISTTVGKLPIPT
ncbi:chymotrypsin-2-like isoform X2 [Pieris rapae]|uniref:chymotrypsin-2-like isoform X2 n=1 Tax=Pieris rapae TaxID=64459 RepID=UPI001E27B314|nr:chymotrypsin-2-like isoform X2 [Pieris rapae]